MKGRDAFDALGNGHGPPRMKLADRILVAGLNNDWVSLLEAADLAKQLGFHSDSATREAVITALKELGEQGLVQFGSVQVPEGFIEWALSAEEALEKLKHDWELSPKDPAKWGFMVWINNTRKGDHRAQTTMDRLD